jgi:2-dehydropantoate 2-reductase
MRVLVVGAGVIGTIYGAHLSAAGHTISVLSRPPRACQLARDGMTAHDVLDGGRTNARVRVIENTVDARFDLVLVAVRSDQLAAACAKLAGLAGAPAVVFFGNNPDGRSAIGEQVPGDVLLGFPGVGGVLRDGTAEYVRIPQQPTALEARRHARLDELEHALEERGFAVQRVADMNGWLACHAAFVACLSAALYRCDTNPSRLADDRATLSLMCTAVTEGFGALHRAGVSGLPRNLAILHSPLLRVLAVRYWARTMRSPMGELCFAAHCRHAQGEMRGLAAHLVKRIGDAPGTGNLRRLLSPAPSDEFRP